MRCQPKEEQASAGPIVTVRYAGRQRRAAAQPCLRRSRRSVCFSRCPRACAATQPPAKQSAGRPQHNASQAAVRKAATAAGPPPHIKSAIEREQLPPSPRLGILQQGGGPI